MIRRRATGLRLWLVVAALIHLALLAAPGHMYEILFPRSGPVPVGRGRDLTPDFAHIAFAVVSTGAIASADVPPDVRPPDVSGSIQPTVGKGGEEAHAGAEQVSTAEGEGSGANLREIPAPLFFPAVPRLIVPPTLEGLGLDRLDVTLRILVDTAGRPERIVVPPDLVDSPVGERLVRSARLFRFEPARKGDLPVPSWVDLPLVLESAR